MKSFSEPDLFPIDAEVTIEMSGDYKIVYQEVKGTKEKCYVDANGKLYPVWTYIWIVNNIKKQIAEGCDESAIFTKVAEWAANTGESQAEVMHSKECLEKYYKVMEEQYQQIKIAMAAPAAPPRKSLFKKKG